MLLKDLLKDLEPGCRFSTIWGWRWWAVIRVVVPADFIGRRRIQGDSESCPESRLPDEQELKKGLSLPHGVARDGDI